MSRSKDGVLGNYGMTQNYLDNMVTVFPTKTAEQAEALGWLLRERDRRDEVKK